MSADPVRSERNAIAPSVLTNAAAAGTRTTRSMRTLTRRGLARRIGSF
jgi:hypothetical protein